MSSTSPTNLPGYFNRYIKLVPESNLTLAFENQLPIIKNFLARISEEKSTFAYAPNKWTLKELLQHMIDTERILSYRALCFARNDMNNLPGFEEDDYAANSYANQRTWQSMVDEFLAVRTATTYLYNSFSEAALSTIGTANNNTISVQELGFTLLGHFYHHQNVIKERYLV
jgi:hypothetical protein